MHRQHLMARIDFEPRWMASRTARGSRSGMVVARGRDDRHRIEIGGWGKRKRIPCENDISADAAWRTAWRTMRHARRQKRGEKQIYDSWARMMFQRCGRLEQLLAEYCNHYVSISSSESLARLSPSRFKNDHDMYIRVQIYTPGL